MIHDRDQYELNFADLIRSLYSFLTVFILDIKGHGGEGYAAVTGSHSVIVTGNVGGGERNLLLVATNGV